MRKAPTVSTKFTALQAFESEPRLATDSLGFLVVVVVAVVVIIIMIILVVVGFYKPRIRNLEFNCSNVSCGFFGGSTGTRFRHKVEGLDSQKDVKDRVPQDGSLQLYGGFRRLGVPYFGVLIFMILLLRVLH